MAAPGNKLDDLEPVPPFATSPRPIPLAEDPIRCIFVVRIADSPLRPHMVRSTGAFYTRGQGGTAVTMGFYEVREQMLFNEDRLRKATLFRLKIAQYRQQIERIYADGDVLGTGSLRRFDTSGFDTLLADVCSLLPPSDALLAELLEIPLYADLVNRQLEQTLHGPVNALAREGVLGRLRDLRGMCEQAEQTLDAAFGPLSRGPL
jgi:hypothetical protein